MHQEKMCHDVHGGKLEIPAYIHLRSQLDCDVKQFKQMLTARIHGHVE